MEEMAIKTSDGENQEKDVSEKEASISNKGKAKIIPINQNKFNLAEQYLSAKYEFRVNIVALTIEYKEYGENIFKEVNENSLFRELQNVNICLSLTNLISLLRSDFVLKFDPLIDYFENLPQWDGEDHIYQLSTYVKTKDQPAWENHLKKHLVRTVKCALNPYYFNKQALILVDPRQNSGKTTFCRFLCPLSLKDYLAEDINTDKDSRVLLAKNILINLDELALLSKKDINSLKSFMSKDQINERLPYDRKNTILSRRASFIGSTNSLEFLNDETGSVRWLCFEINSIDWIYKEDININKVWAQAYYLYETDYVADLSKEEILASEERNKSFHVLTVERQLITELFDFDYLNNPENFRTSSQILRDILKFSNGVNVNHIMVGKALTALRCPIGRDKLSNRGYFIKLKNFSE